METKNSVELVLDQYSLKKPCKNCPFRKGDNAIDLAEGRLEQIIADLVSDDWSTFYCHKSVYGRNSSGKKDKRNYKICAGAMGYLHKIDRPNVGMRLAVIFQRLSLKDLEIMSSMVVDQEKYIADAVGLE